MANLKDIRKRIGSVKNTQKITRAMKMVAGARLHRAQARIQALRPYAVQTAQVLHAVVGGVEQVVPGEEQAEPVLHPLLARREEKRVLILAVTSDRGLCGGFNTNILRRAERMWRDAEAEGKSVQIYTIGRKGRDYFKRREAPLGEHFAGVWDDLELSQARRVARGVLGPFLRDEVDAIYVVYNEFKSAMTQTVVAQPLFPLSADAVSGEDRESRPPEVPEEYIFEPDQKSLLEVLVPMYTEITLLRALYESMASELGARMTAMDAATKNARDMIGSLTLQYNRARQAAITTELMEIIGGAEALNA
ncbi:MAG TPA: ATP synthase F1 subunit gamma [Polyangiaceae bacterium]|nr:ATP synthase F1 subunit gamma [Polyangiaceae bacterium]